VASTSEIGHGLGLREIELAVDEGALRELAGVGQARVRLRGLQGLQAARQQQLQQHRAAVRLQLEHVLAGVAGRRREVDGQAAVERCAVGAQEGQQRGRARRERAAADGVDQRRQVAPRRAHDAHRAAAGRGGDGDDRVGGAAQQGGGAHVRAILSRAAGDAVPPTGRWRGWSGGRQVMGPRLRLPSRPVGAGSSRMAVLSSAAPRGSTPGRGAVVPRRDEPHAGPRDRTPAERAATCR
jgi:hypothetical protein